MHDAVYVMNTNAIPLLMSMVILLPTIMIMLGYYFYIDRRPVLLYFTGVEATYFLYSLFFFLMIGSRTEGEVLFYARVLYTFLLYSTTATAYMVDYITEDKRSQFGRISLGTSTALVLFMWLDHQWILRDKVVYHFYYTPEKGPLISLFLIYALTIGCLLIRKMVLYRREVSREVYSVMRPLLYAVVFFVFHSSIVGVVSVIFPIIKPMNHINILFTTLMIGLYFYNDVKYHIRMKDHIHEMYIKDDLTGVYSRDYILNELDGLMMSVSDRSQFVAFLDMDSFKGINERYGHMVGDRVLKRFGLILSTFIEGGIVVGRIGGDEFLIIFRDTNRQLVSDKLIWLTQAYSRLLEEMGVDIGGRNISVGVVRAEAGVDKIKLLAIADQVMYEAKTSNQNNVVFFA